MLPRVDRLTYPFVITSDEPVIPPSRVYLWDLFSCFFFLLARISFSHRCACARLAVIALIVAVHALLADWLVDG